MQTPESGYDNQYEERGFTAVPQMNAPQSPYPPQQGYQQPYYAPESAQPPQMGQGAVPPAGYQAPYQQPYQQPAPQQAQPQSEYYQAAYQPQQPDPFPQNRQAYQAPKQRNYNKLNMVLGIFIALLAVALIAIAVMQFASNPQVHTALVGVRTVEHAVENCSAMSWELTPEEMVLIDQHIEKLL